MSSWTDLDAALTAAAQRGRPHRFWWRDDDVGIDHPDFPRLLDLAARWSAPVALAVVPLRLAAATVTRIVSHPTATVIQHGFCHRNHAPEGEWRSELGWRSPERVLAELALGRRILEHAFGERYLAVLAPPWNRIDRGVVERLPTGGFVGVSTSGPAASNPPVPGLAWGNVHVDPIDWRLSRPDDRRFTGERATLAALLAALDGDEPLGVMTHHRGADADCWRFLDRLLETLVTHPGGVLLPATRVFAG